MQNFTRFEGNTLCVISPQRLNAIGAKGAAELRVNGREIVRSQSADGSAYVGFGQNSDFVESYR